MEKLEEQLRVPFKADRTNMVHTPVLNSGTC